MKRYVSGVAALGAMLLAACGDHVTQPRLSTPTAGAAANDEIGRSRHPIGGVYVSSNGMTGNSVIAFARLENGALAKIGEFETGGLGIGGGVDPLLSQGSLILSSGHKRLFVVNAGSNSISTFAVSEDASLSLLGTVSSGGSAPDLTHSGEEPALRAQWRQLDFRIRG